MFNETWTSESSILDVENFEFFALQRHRLRKLNAKRDSGGLIIYRIIRPQNASVNRRLQMYYRRLVCIRIEIDQLQCVNC